MQKRSLFPMVDFTIQQLTFRFTALLLITAVHGYALAAAAVALGDRGVRHDDKRSPNPLVHLDAMGALGLLLFSLGWIKPITVDRSQLRRPGLALTLLGLTGAGATLALVVGLRLLSPVVVTLFQDELRSGVLELLRTTANLAVSFALFNLLPIPPLTGRYFLWAAWPRSRTWLLPFRWVFRIGLAALIVSGVASSWLQPAQRMVMAVLFGR